MINQCWTFFGLGAMSNPLVYYSHLITVYFINSQNMATYIESEVKVYRVENCGKHRNIIVQK